MRIAVGCGEDTDCTCATAGSVFGIIYGAAAIPQRWIDPIGRSIKTACLNLGELGFFGNQLPADVDVLTDRVATIAEQCVLRHAAYGVCMVDGDCVPLGDCAELRGQALPSGNITEHHGDMALVCVDYGESGPVIASGQAKLLTISIEACNKIQLNCNLRWYLPAGWRCAQGTSGYVQVFPAHFHRPAQLSMTLEAGDLEPGVNRAVLELTIPGRPTVQLIPITLLNDSMQSAPVSEAAAGCC
jgi:hypothetical protein